MEKPWEELRSHADSVAPDSHKQALAERLHRLDGDSESISPWSEAKVRIRLPIKAG